jgi:hypothetical protein
MQNIKELDMFIDDKMREDAIKFGDWILGNLNIERVYDIDKTKENGEFNLHWQTPFGKQYTTKDIYEMYLSSK